MENNKLIIIVLIVVIVALLVGIFALMPNINKEDAKLTFKSNSTLTEGDSLKIKLTDNNNSAIANQTVNITIMDKDGSCDYFSVVTNENGTGSLKLNKSPGKYNVTINYAGNDKYKASNATKKITVEEKVVEAQVSSSSNSGSSQPSDWYDSEGHHHYYENGIEYVGTRDAQHMDIDTWNYVGKHGMK